MQNEKSGAFGVGRFGEAEGRLWGGGGSVTYHCTTAALRLLSGLSAGIFASHLCDRKVPMVL